MQQFAPRGWRAALAAEREGMARLRVTARESTESVSRHAGRITARLLTPLLSDPPAVPECKLPSVPSQQTEAVCPSLPAAVSRDTGWGLQQHHWLLAVAAVAVIAFIAGWLSGQWHLLRLQRDRRTELVSPSPAPATAAAAAVQAAPVTASLAAAEQAQRHAAGCSAGKAAPSAVGHQSNVLASAQQSAELQPAAAGATAKHSAGESVSSHVDGAVSLSSQQEAVSEPVQEGARLATVQPPAQEASSQSAARQVWRTCSACIPLMHASPCPPCRSGPGLLATVRPLCYTQAGCGPENGPTQLAADETTQDTPAQQQGHHSVPPATASYSQQQVPAVQAAVVATAQPAAATEAPSAVPSAAAQQQPSQPDVSHPAEAEESWNNAAQVNCSAVSMASSTATICPLPLRYHLYHTQGGARS
jgi:hypothetical protein